MELSVLVSSLLLLLLLLFLNQLLVVHPVQQCMILIFVLQMQDHYEKECPLMALECHFNFVSSSLEVKLAFIYFPPQNIEQTALL